MDIPQLCEKNLLGAPLGSLGMLLLYKNCNLEGMVFE